MDVPLNVDFVQKLSDPPWSALTHVAGAKSVVLLHDGRNNAVVHDVGKSHARLLAGLRPIQREIAFISASEHHVVGLLSTGDAFVYCHLGQSLALVRGLPQGGYSIDSVRLT